jgi:hypothetical protein
MSLISLHVVAHAIEILLSLQIAKLFSGYCYNLAEWEGLNVVIDTVT